MRPAAVGVVREWVGKPLCPLCGSLPRLLLLGALGFDAFGGFVHGQATEFVGFGPSHGGPVSGVASLTVDAGGLKPNTWQRLERLSSAWNQAKLVLGDQPDGAADDEPGVVVNPRRRARTPLTESQVDAIRTARANGESVVSICQRFNVHRMTVWTHTRDLF